MKFHHLGQLMLDSNCLLIILKMFGLQEVSSVVISKNDSPDHKSACPMMHHSQVHYNAASSATAISIFQKEHSPKDRKTTCWAHRDLQQRDPHPRTGLQEERLSSYRITRGAISSQPLILSVSCKSFQSISRIAYSCLCNIRVRSASFMHNNTFTDDH